MTDVHLYIPLQESPPLHKGRPRGGSGTKKFKKNRYAPPCLEESLNRATLLNKQFLPEEKGTKVFQCPGRQFTEILSPSFSQQHKSKKKRDINYLTGRTGICLFIQETRPMREAVPFSHETRNQHDLQKNSPG
jgi:hypothetical protein